MRSALLAASFVITSVMTCVACGGGSPPPSHAASTADAGAAGDAASASAAAGDVATSLDALAARGASDAPLMRELVRVERLAPSAALPRADRDICVRALFAASRDVRAWFADESGTMRGEAASGASGAVPPRGPACAKKGELLKLVVEKADAGGGEVSARAVVFAAP